MEGITREEYDLLGEDERKKYQSFDKTGKCVEWQQDGIDRRVAIFKGDHDGVLIVAYTGDRMTRLPLSEKAAKSLMHLLIDNYGLCDGA
jgi:hypothetical protein